MALKTSVLSRVHPGHLYYVSSISHHQISQTCFPKTKNLDNRKSGNMKNKNEKNKSSLTSALILTAGQCMHVAPGEWVVGWGGVGGFIMAHAQTSETRARRSVINPRRSGGMEATRMGRFRSRDLPTVIGKRRALCGCGGVEL